MVLGIAMKPGQAGPNACEVARVVAAAADRYCHAYVWSGRPWDINAGPLDVHNAVWLAENGEY